MYWLKDTLESLDGYYNVSLQNFFTVAQINGSINSFLVNGAAPPEGSYLLFDYSASGNVTAPLVPVSNLGCNVVSLNTTNRIDTALTLRSLITLRQSPGTLLSSRVEPVTSVSSRPWLVQRALLVPSSTTTLPDLLCKARWGYLLDPKATTLLLSVSTRN